MAKITINQLHHGDEYNIKGMVATKKLECGIDEHTAEGRTWIETEYIRQTIVAILKLNKNGDCISDKELGDAVAVFDADKVIEKTFQADRELGILLLTVTKHALECDVCEAADLIDSMIPFITETDAYSLKVMRERISQRMSATEIGKTWINDNWNEMTRVIDFALSKR